MAVRPEPAPFVLRPRLLEAGPRRAERQPTRSQHLEYELLLALVDQRRGELDPPRLLLHASAGSRSAYSSHCAQRSLRPRAVSRYASWISIVVAPTPMSTSSISRIGVTSAAVPVMNSSSAR